MMHPLNTTATSPSFLQPKYDKLRTITFDSFGLSRAVVDEDELHELLDGLPSGFVKDPFFGLGLNFDIRHLVETVEELPGVSDLHLQRGRATGLPNGSHRAYQASEEATKGAV